MIYWCFGCGDSDCPGCKEEDPQDPELDSLEESPEGMGLTPERYVDVLPRSEIFLSLEAGRATHIVLGSLVPVRRVA
jgi:hypothetical protein